MFVKDQFKSLQNSPQYKAWQKKPDSSQAYLAHIFYLTNNPLEIGFYHPDTNTVTSFEMETFEEKSHQEVFSKDPSIPKLDLDSVTVDLQEARALARDVQKKEYPHDAIEKEIAILQCLGNQALYNITFITKTFKTLNIRIDAQNKKILHTHLRSVMDFKASL